jgi:chromate reductase, NAD(P)H dehydrogenase (quinone)
MSIHILGLCGSARDGSLNLQFLKTALAKAEALGAQVELFDLTANPIPLYDPNLEAASGYPASVLALKDRLRACDGVIFASPEYNAAMTPLTKSMIDWASRGSKELGSRNEWAGKPVGLISAGPGGFGGFRSLASLRPVFVEVSALALPEQCSLGRAHEAYHEDGTLKDARTEGFLQSMVERLIFVAERLKAE